MFVFTLIACAGGPADPDPALVLRELAAEATTDLFVEVFFAVGEDRLGAMGDGDTDLGTLALPADADPAHDVSDADLTADYTVTLTLPDPEDPTWRVYDWALTLDIAALALPSADVSGDATWAVRWEQYDFQSGEHTWSGSLAVDGAAPVAVAFSSEGTWSTLNAMEGTIDGAPVSYVNPAPDVP